MPRKSTTGAPKAPAKSAAKAAPAAASATAEKLGNQPAAITDNAAPIHKAPPGETGQPVSAAPGLEADSKGQDARPIIVLDGPEIAGYLNQLKAAGAIGIDTGDVIPLSLVDEPLLRKIGQFVEIDGHDVLPPEQLISMIEAKVGIAPRVTGPAGGYADGDSYRQYPDGVSPGTDALVEALTSLKSPIGPGSEAPAVPQPGGNATDAVDDLAAYLDGDIEGLWITAVPEQGFRRCGYRFTREGFGIALSALTEQQIEQLESEPNLKVERGIFGGRVGVQ